MELIFHHVLMFFFRILIVNGEQDDVTMVVKLWSVVPLSFTNRHVNDPTDPFSLPDSHRRSGRGFTPGTELSRGKMMNSDWKMSR